MVYSLAVSLLCCFYFVPVVALLPNGLAFHPTTSRLVHAKIRWTSRHQNRHNVVVVAASPDDTAATTTNTNITNGGDDDDVNQQQQDILPEIREAVMKAGGGDLWSQSLQLLSDANLIQVADDNEGEDVNELLLATAFGWTDWAKAPTQLKQFKNKGELPNPTKLQQVLQWLTTETGGPLEFTDDQLQRAIQEYPKLYLVDPMELYRQVNGVVPRKYRGTLKELIQDDPNVLQVTSNCEGEGCKGQCGSCWVTYANRLDS